MGLRRAHVAAAMLLAIAALPAPRCIQAGVREAAAPCVRTGVTKEARKAYPDLAAALVLIKHVLAKDALWPEGPGHVGKRERKNIIEILEDPQLVIEYSEPQVAKEHLKGKKVIAAQTIDENTIRLSAFAGKTLYQLAQTLLHELMHVQQLRYQDKPNGGPREWLTASVWEIPAYKIEEDLPMAPFVQVAKDMECFPDDYKDPQAAASGSSAAPAPCPEQVKTRRLCPYAAPGAGAEPCPPGWCWDGGFNHSLACKQENQNVLNAHPTDLNDMVCNDGFSKQVRDPCTNVLLRCE